MFKAAKAIIYYKHRYLLQLRDNKKSIHYPNFWGLFGGRLEKNENPLKGITREIEEEINLKIIKKKFILKSNFAFHESSGLFETLFFECKVRNIKKNIKLNEGQDFYFFSINQIKKNKIIPEDLMALLYHHHSIIKKYKYIVD